MNTPSMITLNVMARKLGHSIMDIKCAAARYHFRPDAFYLLNEDAAPLPLYRIERCGEMGKLVQAYRQSTYGN